ncbi:hypothetical protein Hanom_Chr16g01455041 [Helianthus anomalus]
MHTCPILSWVINPTSCIRTFTRIIIRTYIPTTIVQEMNNLVSDAKTKCFWDAKIMQVCKQWEDTLRKTTVCVPPNSVREPESAACNVDQGDNAYEECRGNVEVQEVIANVVDSVRHMESEGKTCDFICTCHFKYTCDFIYNMRFHM